MSNFIQQVKWKIYYPVLSRYDFVSIRDIYSKINITPISTDRGKGSYSSIQYISKSDLLVSAKLGEKIGKISDLSIFDSGSDRLGIIIGNFAFLTFEEVIYFEDKLIEKSKILYRSYHFQLKNNFFFRYEYDPVNADGIYKSVYHFHVSNHKVFTKIHFPLFKDNNQEGEENELSLKNFLKFVSKNMNYLRNDSEKHLSM